MPIHDHPDLGVSVEVTHNKGALIVNVVSTRAVGLQFNGTPVKAALRKPLAPAALDVSGGDENEDMELEVVKSTHEHRLRPTFWNPDGTQTTEGTIDLRGEER